MHPRTPLSAWLLMAASFGMGQAITFEEGLRLAKKNRLLIGSAESNVTSARHALQAAGLPRPIVLGAGASSRAGLGATDQDLYLEAALDIFGKARASASVSQAEVKRAEAELIRAKLTVQQEALEAFAKALASQEGLRVAESLRAAAEGVAQATRRRSEEGQAPEIQVRRAQMALDRARQKEDSARLASSSSLSSLAGALGIRSIEGVAEGFLHAESAPEGCPPDVLFLDASLAAARADRNSAIKSRGPEVALLGIRSPWDEGPSRMAARVQVTWTLWDHGRARAEDRASEALIRSLEEAKKDAFAKARAEANSVEIDLQSSAAALEAMLRMKEEAESLVTLSQKGFREGVGSLLDVLDAVRTLAEIEEDMVQTRLSGRLLLIKRLSVTGALLEAMK